MSIIKYILLPIIFIFMGCQVEKPILVESDNEPNIFIDYNEIKNEIYASISLEDFDFVPDSALQVDFAYIESDENIIACFENDSLISGDFNSEINLIESNCLFYPMDIKGCLDENAVNFDFYATENSDCIYEGDWHQFKFGEFDEMTYSFPVYLITSSLIQYFEFEIIGLKIDDFVEVIPNSIANFSESKITSNYLFPALNPGIIEIGRIYISKPPLYFQLELFDNGLNADMIANNKVYHTVYNLINFIPGDYNYDFLIFDNNGDEQILNGTVNLNYNFRPKILEVEIPEEVMLHDSLWTELEFYVKVFDANNGIEQVKYLINTSNLSNDSIPILSEDVFTSDPSWTMEYNNFVEKNMFRYRTAIPLRPAQHENPEEEGKTGEAKFRFVVYDSENERNSFSNELQFETSIMLLKCGDEICSEEFENVNICPEDCVE